MKAKMGNSLILGLSDENIRRLKGGEPIKFNCKDLSLPDIDVFIFNAKDEYTMREMFKDKIHPFKTL
jgi:hypothetical protein